MLYKHNNIKSYLNDKSLNFRDADVIQISWRMYGDNGYVHKPSGGVLKNFQNNPKILNHIENKIIIKGGLSNVKLFIGHAGIANNNANRIKYANGKVRGVYDPFIDNPDYTVAALDHFFTKSTEEFINRKSHGRLDLPSCKRSEFLLSSKNIYYALNEKTEEKEKMFQDAAKKLMDKD